VEDFERIDDANTMSILGMPLQNCPVCGKIIGAFSGGRDAVCNNCGYKDPCCE